MASRRAASQQTSSIRVVSQPAQAFTAGSSDARGHRTEQTLCMWQTLTLGVAWTMVDKVCQRPNSNPGALPQNTYQLPITEPYMSIPAPRICRTTHVLVHS